MSYKKRIVGHVCSLFNLSGEEEEVDLCMAVQLHREITSRNYPPTLNLYLLPPFPPLHFTGGKQSRLVGHNFS